MIFLALIVRVYLVVVEDYVGLLVLAGHRFGPQLPHEVHLVRELDGN